LSKQPFANLSWLQKPTQCTQDAGATAMSTFCEWWHQYAADFTKTMHTGC
jgi:hypothetical protein